MSDQHNLFFSQKWINLAEKRLGSQVYYATDDFFAPKENLIESGRGVFIEDKFTDNGKWMDGWESRRRRDSGHDYCEVKLGLRGVIKGLDIDTNHFTGNHPEFASVQAACCDGGPDERTKWEEILEKKPLTPGSQHLFEIDNSKAFTHVRLHIYPDGGVARFRVYGQVKRDWNILDPSELIDLAHVENEGKAIICSDMYFSHKDNINAPGKGINMGDGWETKRRRCGGHDWIILALGKRGVIKKACIDTSHFKGNFPESCSLEGINLEQGQTTGLDHPGLEWKELHPEYKLGAHQEHFLEENISSIGPITHVRLNIFPDGGISRLRLFGYLT